MNAINKKTDAYRMVAGFDSTSLARDYFKAAMHFYDFILRQHILKKWNLQYYKIIKKFGQLTGVGRILDTSFNLHGCPIIFVSKEAFDVFEHLSIYYLALENFLIEKFQHE